MCTVSVSLHHLQFSHAILTKYMTGRQGGRHGGTEVRMEEDTMDGWMLSNPCQVVYTVIITTSSAKLSRYMTGAYHALLHIL